MEDTLRYFFSAVFQGFAAIITLGIMFYLYYLDKLSGKALDIKTKLSRYQPGSTSKGFMDYEQKGIIVYLKTHLLPTKVSIEGYGHARELVSDYDSIDNQKKSLSKKLKKLFKIARIILIVSLISLFSIGYYEWFNYVLFGCGIICIILSIVFFSSLYTFSKEIIDGQI